MPELIEVECYRRLADDVVGRRITGVDAPDAWFVKGGRSPADLAVALEGRTVVATRRIGKLLLLDTGPVGRSRPGATGGPTIGLHFGMTGRLIVGDRAPVEQLQYASGRDDPAWNRFGLRFARGAPMRVSDPRRLGGVTLDPDESALGPDAASIGLAALNRALGRSPVALKARLLDQARVAGVGNLIADETLWRAGIDPARPVAGLDDRERRRLHRQLRATIAELTERGGSHTGDLMAQRQAGGVCPKDGEPLQRRTIGGRTTFSCPRHQL